MNKKIKISIKYKLVAIIVSITLASILIGFYIINKYIQVRIHEKFEQESITIADFIGELIVPTLTFQDEQGAYDLISKLDKIEEFNGIVIYDLQGQIFSQYFKSDSKNLQFDLTGNNAFIDTLIVKDNNLIALHKITYNNELYGSMAIVFDFVAYNKLLNEINYSLLIITMIVGIIIVVLSLYFQGFISKPIIELTNIALEVQYTNDYSLRAKAHKSDEVGILNHTFNTMLSKIEIHNVERDKNENLIRENELKYKILFNYSPIPIFIFENFDCALANNAAIRLFNADDDDEIIGKRYSQLFFSNQPTSYDEIFINKLNFEPIASNDFVIINNDNERRVVELTAMILKNDVVTSRIIMCIDVSDRIHYQNELISLNHELELRVKDRTSVLENSIEKIYEQNLQLSITEHELRIAKDEAERANNIKSEFIAHISHEIRTPMNIIKGYSDMLYKQLTDPVNIKMLKSIVYSSDTLLSIINDLLDISKMEAGKLTIVPTNVELKRHLMEIKDMFSSKATDKGLEFIFELDHRLPSNILIDGVRLNQIFFNLISNALKFTEHGFIKIKCWHKALSSDFINLYIDVHDTGIGIEKENIDIIFDAFAQERMQYKSSQLGTGLGLTITKRLVESFNGVISVESEVGEGTTFKIVFHDVQIVKNDNNESLLPSEKLSFDGKIKALVIDDFDLNRVVLMNKLDEYGIQCHEAFDIKSALDLLTIFNYDIIFIDLVIPGTNGIEIARHFRSSGISNNCPLIAYSALHKFNLEDNGLFDGFLFKPIKNKILKLIINQHLAGSLNIDENTEKSESDTGQNQLIDLLDILENQWVSKAEKLADEMIIDDIQVFANHIHDLSKEFQVQLFSQYVEFLVKAVDEFDIGRIKNLLKSLHILSKELKLLLQ